VKVVKGKAPEKKNIAMLKKEISEVKQMEA
jgi:hypothetical protein